MNPKDPSGSKFYDSMNVAADFFFQVSLFGENINLSRDKCQRPLSSLYYLGANILL